ncbi:hypothetical protein BDN70DRAFT_870845 [Pholiota conissans]|uniref:Uncharacterized protein n=1 Tax=Pholiota conissans TaxID=109636 RepID=A0A9P6CZ22_9AGAR|nr:hypothetical protein BDN70DRAFT_870845 [Pholiota conissans]
MGRSAHPDFVYTCKNLLTLCERRMENSTSMLFSAISTWTGTLDALDYPTYVSSPTSAFICAMHQMYRLGMKQSQFKGYSAICNFLDKDDTLLDSVAHNIHFYALDIHDGYTSSGDLDLSSNCDIDLEFQAAVDFQMDLLHLGLESPYLVPTTNDVWLSDSEADLGEDEELYDFSGMPSLEDRSQQSTSEESIDECAPSHDALEPSFQCDWSPDKHASQKIVGSSLGMTLSPDSTGFHEIDVGTLGASPGLSTYLGPTRGEDYVEEHLFCDSPFGRLVGSELVNDHGTTSFEDEHASLPMLSGNEELEIRFTASCTNNRQVKKYFEENLEHLAPLSDSSNTSMECDLRLEASHSVLRTNVDVPNFLIMDFD